MPSLSNLLQRVRQACLTERDPQIQQLVLETVASGATPICEAQPRTRVVLHGRICVVTFEPRGANKRLETELTDGTGTVTLRWMGRNAIIGVRIGTRMTVEGMLIDENEHRVIYNPRYWLHP